MTPSPGGVACFLFYPYSPLLSIKKQKSLEQINTNIYGYASKLYKEILIYKQIDMASVVFLGSWRPAEYIVY